MNRKQTKLFALAAAISAPGLLVAAPLATGETQVEGMRLAQTEGRQMQQLAPGGTGATLRTPDGRELTEQQIREEIRRELAALTPEQRRELGSARITRLQRMSGSELMDLAISAEAGTCVSKGVLCQGTKGFSEGVICCLGKKMKL